MKNHTLGFRNSDRHTQTFKQTLVAGLLFVLLPCLLCLLPQRVGATEKGQAGLWPVATACQMVPPGGASTRPVVH